MSGFILTAYIAFFVALLLLGGFLLWERRVVKQRLERLSSPKDTASKDTGPKDTGPKPETQP